MSQTVNSGNVVATITLNSASKRAATVLNAVQSGVGTTTVLTVGAGKVVRILTMQMTSNGNGNATFLLNDVLFTKLYSLAAAPTNNQTATWTYTDCPVLAAGQTVKVTSDNAACVGYLGLSYIEESA